MALCASSPGLAYHCSCSFSASARPQRSSATVFLPPSVQASSSSLVFRDGMRELLPVASRKSSSRAVRQRGQLQVVGLFGLGVPELVVIGGVAVLLFGPKQLPELGKNLGKTLKGFQAAAKEFESELGAGGAAGVATAESSKSEGVTQKPAASTGGDKDTTAV